MPKVRFWSRPLRRVLDRLRGRKHEDVEKIRYHFDPQHEYVKNKRSAISFAAATQFKRSPSVQRFRKKVQGGAHSITADVSELARLREDTSRFREVRDRIPVKKSRLRSARALLRFYYDGERHSLVLTTASQYALHLLFPSSSSTKKSSAFHEVVSRMEKIQIPSVVWNPPAKLKSYERHDRQDFRRNVLATLRPVLGPIKSRLFLRYFLRIYRNLMTMRESNR